MSEITKTQLREIIVAFKRRIKEIDKIMIYEKPSKMLLELIYEQDGLKKYIKNERVLPYAKSEKKSI